MMKKYDWSKIGLVGVAGAGKDVAGETLARYGYKRHNLGDLIKGDIEPIVQKRLGVSAFTEDRTYKEKFRQSLEYVGNDFYDSYLEEYWATAPALMFSTRVMRKAEGEAWRERNHPLILIRRKVLNPVWWTRWFKPYIEVQPKTRFERECMKEIQPYVTHTLWNDSSISMLHDRLEELLERELHPLQPQLLQAA
jgi:hypothetical protein